VTVPPVSAKFSIGGVAGDGGAEFVGRTTMAVSWHELEDAFEFVSFDGGGANQVFLCRKTGRLYWHSDHGGDLDELPDDIEDGEKYIAIPDKRELGLDTQLVFAFTRQFLPTITARCGTFSAGGAPTRVSGISWSTGG
jgi:hypothetical protein